MTRATAAEMLEDSFPHSTPEGYERGCRGSKCRGIEDFGWSCTYAMQQYRGDYHYRQWVDAGKTPAEIKDLRGGAEKVAAAEAASRQGRKSGLDVAPVPVVTVADSREPVRERPKPRPVPNPAAKVRPVIGEKEIIMTTTEIPAGFEVFHRSPAGRSTNRALVATVSKSGHLRLSPAAHAEVGEYVALLFDREAERLALQPVTADFIDAYKVHPKGHYVSATAFVRHYGLEAGRRWELRREGGLLVGEVLQP